MTDDKYSTWQREVEPYRARGFFRIKEAAPLLGISVPTVRRHIRSQRLPWIEVPFSWGLTHLVQVTDPVADYLAAGRWQQELARRAQVQLAIARAAAGHYAESWDRYHEARTATEAAYRQLTAYQQQDVPQPSAWGAALNPSEEA